MGNVFLLFFIHSTCTSSWSSSPSGKRKPRQQLFWIPAFWIGITIQIRWLASFGKVPDLVAGWLNQRPLGFTMVSHGFTEDLDSWTFRILQIFIKCSSNKWNAIYPSCSYASMIFHAIRHIVGGADQFQCSSTDQWKANSWSKARPWWYYCSTSVSWLVQHGNLPTKTQHLLISNDDMQIQDASSRLHLSTCTGFSHNCAFRSRHSAAKVPGYILKISPR